MTATKPTGFVQDVDYYIHSPNSGSEIKAFDITASAASGTDITFTATDIDGSTFGSYAAAAGDYVCLAGECALPFLPYEMHPLVAIAAASANRPTSA